MLADQGIAKALNYSANAWEALTRNLFDGEGAHRQQPLRESDSSLDDELAIGMNLARPAEFNGLDPWAYLQHVKMG